MISSPVQVLLRDMSTRFKGILQPLYKFDSDAFFCRIGSHYFTMSYKSFGIFSTFSLFYYRKVYILLTYYYIFGLSQIIELNMWFYPQLVLRTCGYIHNVLSHVYQPPVDSFIKLRLLYSP